MPADENVIYNGNLAHDLHVLKSTHQPQADDVVHMHAHQVHAAVLRRRAAHAPPPVLRHAEEHLPPVWAVELGDAVENSGLARAVGADKAKQLPFVYVEAEPVDRLQAAKGDGQIPDGEYFALSKSALRFAAGFIRHLYPSFLP